MTARLRYYPGQIIGYRKDGRPIRLQAGGAAQTDFLCKTTDTSYVVPAGVFSLQLDMWEAGAGGGGSSTDGGGGGGGGAHAQWTGIPVTPGNTITVSIPAGGIGATITGSSPSARISITLAAGDGGTQYFVSNSTTTTWAQPGSGQNGGSGGTPNPSPSASSSSSGGHGGTGALSGTQRAGGGGGSSGGLAGNGNTGGNGALNTPGSGGTAPDSSSGAGGSGGSSGLAGGTPTAGNSLYDGGGSNAPNPGGGAGGGGKSGGTGGTGAAGGVAFTYTPLAPSPTSTGRYPQHAAIPQMLVSRKRQNADFVPTTFLAPWSPPRHPQFLRSQLPRQERGQAPTGWPVPVQPLEIPSSEHARFKPPYPRRGVTITQFPTPNIPPTESYRAKFKPPYPRRGVVPPTGWPVPVQPLFIPDTGVHPHDRVRRRRPARGTSEWPGTPPVLIQPPWSSWVFKRRWTKPLFPRKAVVPPSALPPPPIVFAYNPTSERRLQRYQWFRRGNVPPTGWPIPVQPPMLPGPYGIRRYSRPLWPRRGVVPVNALPPHPPVPMWFRARFKPPYPRRGNPQPNSGLPIPVQPPEVSKSVRRWSKPLYKRRGNPAVSAGPYFVPIQPPERMQSMRRWSRPLWPLRGRTNIATFPGVQVVSGYVTLPLQTFTYTPGGPGTDLTSLNLILFPLNKIGVTFWNPYGDVILVVYNSTSLACPITPNVIRTIELQSIELPSYVLQPGAMQAFGPFPYNDFSNPQLNNPPFSYYMTVDIEASDSGVYAGAFRLVWAPPIGHTGPYDLLGKRLRNLIRGHEESASSTPGELHPGETSPGA